MREGEWDMNVQARSVGCAEEGGGEGCGGALPSLDSAEEADSMYTREWCGRVGERVAREKTRRVEERREETERSGAGGGRGWAEAGLDAQ